MAKKPLIPHSNQKESKVLTSVAIAIAGLIGGWVVRSVHAKVPVFPKSGGGPGEPPPPPKK